MSLVGQIRFVRAPNGRPSVVAPPEAGVLADFLETDVGEDVAYVLEKLDQAEEGDEIGISLNACYLEADKDGVRLEHLHREGEGMRCTLSFGELRSLLTAWAAFLRNA